MKLHYKHHEAQAAEIHILPGGPHSAVAVASSCRYTWFTPSDPEGEEGRNTLTHMSPVGQLVVFSSTGSQLPSLPYNSNLASIIGHNLASIIASTNTSETMNKGPLKSELQA